MEPEPNNQDPGTLIAYGGAVKAIEGKPAGWVGGYLIQFGSPTETDDSRFRDFFTPTTDYAIKSHPAPIDVYYHHGLDPQMGRKRLGLEAAIKHADDVGQWIEAQLDLRDEWERAIYERLVLPGKASWSSGTAMHLIDRLPIKSGDRVIAHEIKHWPLRVDASLTPTPADYRNMAVALKSIDVPDLAALVGGQAPEAKRSLAERTELWLETGDDLLAGYRQVVGAEMKIGRALSASRRERLLGAREIIDALLAETEVRDEPAEDALTVTDDGAPGMGAETNDATQKARSVQVERLKLRTQALLLAGRC